FVVSTHLLPSTVACLSWIVPKSLRQKYKNPTLGFQVLTLIKVIRTLNPSHAQPCNGLLNLPPDHLVSYLRGSNATTSGQASDSRTAWKWTTWIGRNKTSEQEI